MKIPYDSIGDIVIFKFPLFYPAFYKRFYSRRFLKKNKSYKVALEKIKKFDGILRIQKTKYLSGENRKETLHKENGCYFFLDVDKTYFSSRLSQERKLISEEILKNITKKKIKKPNILVLFSGVSPLPIVLAKILKEKNIKAEIVSSELNKDACFYGLKNVERNKLKDYISVEQGDSRLLCNYLSKKKVKFDFILMPRPNLEDSFLDSSLKVSKKGTEIYYHGFGTEEKVKKEILQQLVKSPKIKFSHLKFRKAGDIGVKSYRWNVNFKRLN